jgi:hypothetical protein
MLVMSSSQSSAHSTAARNTLSKSTLTSLSSLTFTSSLAKSQRLSSKGVTLYFSTAKVASILTSFELPPKPPVGSFDARFADGNAVEQLSVTSASAALEEVPLQLQWDGGQVHTVVHLADARTTEYFLIQRSGRSIAQKIRLVDGADLQLDGSGKSTYSLAAAQLPLAYRLYQNYPNPFNPTTTLSYDLPKAGRVTIRIYNVLGQVVQTLVDETEQAGHISISFDASKFASGMYFYRMTAGSFSDVKKMVLLK